MIGGYAWPDSAIDSRDVHYLSVLISHYVTHTHSDFIPVYVQKLFANIVQNVSKIHLNMYNMKVHDGNVTDNRYGYRLLKPLFFVGDMVNFSKLFQILNRDLQEIVISAPTKKKI